MKPGIINTFFKDPVTGQPDYSGMQQRGFAYADYQQLCDTTGPLYAMDEASFEAELTRQKELAQQSGISFSQVHGPWPVDDTSAEKRVQNLEYYKRTVRGCFYLGSPCLVVHPVMPEGWGEEKDPDAAEQINEAFLKELTDYARPYGVTICLENMPFKLHRLSHVPEIVKTVQKLHIDNLGICFDTGHGNLYGDDAGELVRQCGSLLRTLHVHDNNGEQDQHLIPGQGTICWNSFLQGLRAIGFGGCYSLECSPQPGEVAEKLVLNCIRELP